MNVGWVEAAVLTQGQQLLLLDGTTATVDSAVTSTLAEPIEVFNLTVTDGATYFVDGPQDGVDTVVVHNASRSKRAVDLYKRLTGRSSRNVHDVFTNKVRPGARERVFDAPWSTGKGLGSRKFDDFDDVTATGFEANTTAWSKMTQEQLTRKLNQAGADFALLKTDPRVQRVIWFGTENLPTSGLGGQLREALAQAGIQYWRIVP